MSPEIQTTYPQEPVIVDGIYSATLKDAVTYAAKDFDGNDIQKLAWTFDVEAPEDALDDDVETEIEGWTYSGHFEIAFHTTFATGPKSKMRPMLEAVLGEVPKKLNTDQMIGMPCQVYVSSFTRNSGNVSNGIEKVTKPKKGQKAGKPRTKTQSEKIREAQNQTVDEGNFDDLPFAHFSTKQLIVEGIL